MKAVFGPSLSGLAGPRPDGWVRADWHEFRRRFRTTANSSATLKHYLVDSLEAPEQQIMSSVEMHQKKVATTALQCRQRYPQLSFDEQRRFILTWRFCRITCAAATISP